MDSPLSPNTPDGPAARWRDPAVLVCAAATLVWLAFVWGFPRIAAQDHPNHVASLYVLDRLRAQDGFFVERFALAPGVVPDLMAEIITYLALRSLPVETAGKVLLTLYVVGLPLAWWRFLRAHCAGDTAALPVASLVTMNVYYATGGTNFLLGMPLFLMAAAAWERTKEGWRPTALFLFWSALTWLSHVYDYSFLLVVVTLHLGLALITRRRITRPQVAAYGALLAGLALSVRAVFSAADPWAQSGPTRFNFSPRELVHLIDQPVFFRGDGGLLVLVVCIGASVVVTVIARRRESPGSWASLVHPLAALSAAALALCFWVFPESIGSEDAIRPRFTVPCFMLAFAGLTAPASRRHRAVGAAVLAAIIGLKARSEYGVHVRFNREAAAVMDAFLPLIPRHASVLPVFLWQRRDSDDWSHHGVERSLFAHFPEYAVPARDAFVTTLFDAPGQQLLRYRGAYKRAPIARFDDLTPASLLGADFLWIYSDDHPRLRAALGQRVEPVASHGRSVLLRVIAPSLGSPP